MPGTRDAIVIDLDYLSALPRWLYRHSDTSALLMPLGRYNKPLVSLRCVDHDGQQIIEECFSTHPKATWSALAPWDHVGIAAMKSETPMAQQVQAYFPDVGVESAVN